MKAIIFAGGVGTRLWPLSRRDSPKQFEKVVGDKSTLQLAVERLAPNFSWDDIYVATGERYIPLVLEQLPLLPPDHVIGEPVMRDVGPAVGLVTANLLHKNPNTPIVILWSDHIIKNVDRFKHILTVSEKVVQKRKNTMVFISQKPRFASQNLGWIKFGQTSLKESDLVFHTFEQFVYRPNLELAEKFFKNGNYAWNLGYFVTTPSYLWSLFEKYQPVLFDGLKKIYKSINTPKYKSTIDTIYKDLPKVSFDNAILEKISAENAYVLSEDLGWSDVGAWEALKEALQTSPNQNVTRGKVLMTDCEDNLVYNYTDQLLVAIDLKEHIVINTHDVILVCHKNSVPKIKKLVERLSETDNDHLV